MALVQARTPVRMGLIAPDMLDKSWLDPDEYPFQEEAKDALRRNAPEPDIRKAIKVSGNVIGLVWRQEETEEGLSYLTYTFSNPPDLGFDGPPRSREVSILTPLNCEEFGLRPGNYGERHIKPPRGFNTNPEHVHVIGPIAWNELVAPIGRLALSLERAGL